MSNWPRLCGSAAVLTPACSAVPIHWALHACCQTERRGKQPLCFSLQRNKSTVCIGTTGTTECCDGDSPLQTATRSWMMWRQMPYRAGRISGALPPSLLFVRLFLLCTRVLMWTAIWQFMLWLVLLKLLQLILSSKWMQTTKSCMSHCFVQWAKKAKQMRLYSL